jgi:hypothetical protein
MNLITGHEPTILEWLARNHGVHVLQTPRVVFGVVDGQGVLRGSYILTWRNDTTAELHAYGTVSNDTVKQLFRSAFGAYRLYRLQLVVPRKSKAVRRGVHKMGFQFEGLAREYYGPGMDGFCYGMTAPQCRWIRGGSNRQHVQVA